MAILANDTATQKLFAAAVELDKFTIEVRALTGWSDEVVQRLIGRITHLSIVGPRSFDHYCKEWRRRYVFGWGSFQVRRSVVFAKIRRDSFGELV